MYSALKRLTPMIVLAIKSAMTRKWPPWQVTGSVGTAVLGCLVASMGDLAFDARGYFFALMSCFTQASYLLLVERSGESPSTWPPHDLHGLPLCGHCPFVAALGGLFSCSGPPSCPPPSRRFPLKVPRRASARWSSSTTTACCPCRSC